VHQQISEIPHNIKFHENRFSDSRVFHADRQLHLQFCNISLRKRQKGNQYSSNGKQRRKQEGKCKGKVVPVLNYLSTMPQRHMWDMWEWRYSSNFLDLGARWRPVFSFTPLSLYPLGKRPPPGTHWMGDWVDLRVRLGAMEKIKIFRCRESNMGHPARSPSLYRLSYPDSEKRKDKSKKRESKIEIKKHYYTKKQKYIHAYVGRFCKGEHQILTCGLRHKYCHVRECDYTRVLD
jgi:hypothetical protein